MDLNKNENAMVDFFGGFVHRYSRAQAIEDGMLIDVTETAKEAGFKVPVAVTHAVWDGCIEPSEKLKEVGQSVSGRLWDVLWMCALKARFSEGDRFLFALYVRYGTREHQIKKEILKAVIGPGDQGEPVITIMEPGED